MFLLMTHIVDLLSYLLTYLSSGWRRAAAARCRNKKKLWMTNLEQKADNMVATNAALQVRLIVMLMSDTLSC